MSEILSGILGEMTLWTSNGMVVESSSERGLEDLGGGHNHAVREGRDSEPPHKSDRIRDGSVRIEKGNGYR